MSRRMSRRPAAAYGTVCEPLVDGAPELGWLAGDDGVGDGTPVWGRLLSLGSVLVPGCGLVVSVVERLRVLLPVDGLLVDGVPEVVPAGLFESMARELVVPVVVPIGFVESLAPSEPGVLVDVPAVPVVPVEPAEPADAPPAPPPADWANAAAGSASGAATTITLKNVLIFMLVETCRMRATSG